MFGRCLFVCFQSRWSQVRERNISEAVLSLKLFYPVSNVCSSKCLNFFAAGKTYATFLRDKFIKSASKLPRSFISGNPSKMPVKCQYKFLTRLIFLFSGSSCYLLTSERDEDNPFKQSNNFYFVLVN